MDRRTFLRVGGAAAAGLALPGLPGAVALPAASRVHTVRMWSDPTGAEVGFDPSGLAVAPGATVRWILDSGVHSTTAYHADLHGRSTRMPAGARPWDSGILTRTGESFEVTLVVPGVYDYYCRPHEAAGMVGRVVVGRPDEDFEAPAYARTDRRSDALLPPSARSGFPPVDRIVRHGRVRDPGSTNHPEGGPR